MIYDFCSTEMLNHICKKAEILSLAKTPIIQTVLICLAPMMNSKGYELKSVNVACMQRNQHVKLILLESLLPRRTLQHIYVIILVQQVHLQKTFSYTEAKNYDHLEETQRSASRSCFQLVFSNQVPVIRLKTCQLGASSKSSNFQSNICREITSQHKTCALLLKLRSLCTLELFCLNGYSLFLTFQSISNFFYSLSCEWWGEKK